MATSSVSTTSSISTSISTEDPPLTTLFTPNPACLSLHLDRCDSPSLCFAKIFTSPVTYYNTANMQYTFPRSLSCYPSTTLDDNPWLTPVLTYSPGYFCPMGMTTAASAISPNGVWCCPTGLTWASLSPLCQNTITRGTFLRTPQGSDCLATANTFAFGPDAQQFFTWTIKTLASDENPFGGTPSVYATTIVTSFRLDSAVVTVSGTGIFLAGQTFPISTSMTPENTLSTASPPVPGDTGGSDEPAVMASHGPSMTVKISMGVGISFGSVVVIGLLVYLLIRRHRKKKTHKMVEKAPVNKASYEEHTGKPELEGSKAYVYVDKAELDPTATRSELPGAVGESYGDGIYLVKPELEGTIGTEENRGMFVRKKSELEAASVLRAANYTVELETGAVCPGEMTLSTGNRRTSCRITCVPIANDYSHTDFHKPEQSKASEDTQLA
ncbi:hypothetical protein HD806DRAFT_246669 [Xylariaceae sp. AK1471]|nr:hypothetical protein HD806DRAFT_246669 [Xylariaceae sp. AK1471]